MHSQELRAALRHRHKCGNWKLKVFLQLGRRLGVVVRLEELDAAVLELHRLFGTLVQRIHHRTQVLLALDKRSVIQVLKQAIGEKGQDVAANLHDTDEIPAAEAAKRNFHLLIDREQKEVLCRIGRVDACTSYKKEEVKN